MKRWRRLGLWAAIMGAGLGAPAGAQMASAQILGPVGGAVGGVVGDLPAVGPTVGRTTGDVLDRTTGLVDQALDPQQLVEGRARRLADLVARNRQFLEADPAGDPVVRGEVVAIAPTPQALDAARAAGFSVLRESSLGELGLEVTILAPPSGVSARDAVRRLRKLDPAGAYDFNHLYLGAAEAARTPSDAAPASPATPTEGVELGLIDTGVAAGLPVFAGVAVEQRGFAAGAPRPAAHGTATASLVSGRLGGFHGAAPGARLFVADIFGAAPAGGSAEALAAALEWLAEARAPVINISLVGPPNALVGAAVAALNRRGTRIVAAVGNDGPAAPPSYPASYPEVIAVVPVDAHGRVLPEASRATHVDFAAPGAGLSAADLTGRLSPVRGASFAAPIVAGRLARLLRREDPAEAAQALAELAREAKPAGRAAGHGVVGEDVRLASGRR